MATPVETTGPGSPEWLCAAHLSGACKGTEDCSGLHHDQPYLWQAQLEGVGWSALPCDGAVLEKVYCQPGALNYSTEVPLTYQDGETAVITLQVDFEKMMAHLDHSATRHYNQRFMVVRRLSTLSYVTPSPTKGPGPSCKGDQYAEAPPASCPWRWYYDDGTKWSLFEEDGISPMQWVLEAKYVAGQRIYRFEIELKKNTYYHKSATETAICLIDFSIMKMYNLLHKRECCIRRRPLYISPDNCLLRRFAPFPPTKPIACNWSELPESWSPIDQGSDYEIVPLDPESFDFHLVKSEFIKEDKLPNSTPATWTVQDIYRLQNPFLWHKYQSKKRYMERKIKNANEQLLFHGTCKEVAVQSIFRQNFDWRLSGQNMAAYGEGSYFAREAALSDRYTGGIKLGCHWMFLARILAGRCTHGVKGMKRPPPIDPTKPHGDLYDSCIGKTDQIFVIFDSDQCYPEYVISYTR